ncbi:hypothetical protein ARHIZOSPH14_12770 [Agromyces rhizosphaerae]|uniref:DUF2255 family protein n=1 Tax=Agromyces rhizosphaerae TaxID=88374 RepID=A0A9W6CWM9_9MICO|nr:DUF2255 family protein [Agromyces rhizosphaerae]GLI27035.1 hypothetical protein ARHIZOSPH14_12770 [Agromyces rhizosphaerae]
MPTWTPDELDSLDRTQEIRVAGRKQDGSLRTLTIVWHVVVDGALYVRSYKGADGQWYKGVLRNLAGAVSWGGQTRDVTYIPDDAHDEDVDAAYFAKYGDTGPTRAMVAPSAVATTLRVEPAA